MVGGRTDGGGGGWPAMMEVGCRTASGGRMAQRSVNIYRNILHLLQYTYLQQHTTLVVIDVYVQCVLSEIFLKTNVVCCYKYLRQHT